MSKQVENKIEYGGLAQFCVEHREVSWLALIAVLVWGGLAYTKLGQQEDPTIPQRTAMLVTAVPGRDGLKSGGVGVQTHRAQNQRTQIDRGDQDHVPARHLHDDDQAASRLHGHH